MPTLNIEGKRVRVDDSFLSLSPEQQNATVEEIARSMAGSSPSAEMGKFMQGVNQQFKAPQRDIDTNVRANMEATKLNDMWGDSAFRAASQSIDSGALFGFDDEIKAGFGVPIRMLRDRVGSSEAYTREKALQDELKARRREDHPVASMVGEIAGGIGTGGMLAKGGATLIGLNVPILGRTGAAAAEGAAYGGLYGAGEAESGDRLGGAARGAAIGGVTGGVLSKAGDIVANRLAAKATEAATPTVEAMRAQESALFDAARNTGAIVKPQAMNKLIGNMQAAAGRLNPNLRQKTAGMVDDLISMKGRGADIQAIHELRQEIGQSMINADPQDVRTLSRMMSVLDSFIDNAKPGAMVGGPQALGTLREAINLSSRRFKAERISRLLDLADVKTGQYTQSGMMNAIRSEASTLYKQIIDGRVKGFTGEEIAIIRQLAKTEQSSKAVKLIAKLAPRGVVSMGMGSGLMGAAGAAIGGPVGAAAGAAIPAGMGAVAARSADRAALDAARGLLGSISRGGPPQQAVNRLGKYVPLAAPTATELLLPRPQQQPR